MNNKTTLLIVEDDKAIVHFISSILSVNEYRTLYAGTGREAISLIASYRPDVVLLDLGLPDIDGLDVLKTVRQWSEVPIIVVSARGREQEKVQALDLGADDYITKPFGTAELLARIRTALRHSMRPEATNMPTGRFKTGELEIDFDRRLVMVEGRDVHLTQIEYKIVTLIAQHIGRVLTYDYIIQQIWGIHHTKDNQILRVNMANIRRKLEKNPAEPRFISLRKLASDTAWWTTRTKLLQKHKHRRSNGCACVFSGLQAGSAKFLRKVSWEILHTV